MAVYRIDEFLGEGGFAYVYRARDTNLDIDVALKVLKPAFAYDEVFEENFRREAHRAAKFRHPNVIAIHYAGRDDDVVFFSMDLLETGLKKLIKPGQPLEDSLIIKVGIDVASALQFAHTHEGGIVHRDLKPDNILFDRHGNAVVTDFGISEAASNYTAATGTTVYVGTPRYMSPEQARGQRVDHRSDIYSLGVTLYEMATGDAPFIGRDWFELGRKHIEEVPPLPRERNGKLNPVLERMILRCLQKSPSDRYQSAEELRCELLALGGDTQRTISVARVLSETQRVTSQAGDSVQASLASASPSPQSFRGTSQHLGGEAAKPFQPRARGRHGRLWTALVLLTLFGGTVAAYATNLQGFRNFGEEKLPILANIPYLGTGHVYASELRYVRVEGGRANIKPVLHLRFSGPIDVTTAKRPNIALFGPGSREISLEIELEGDRVIRLQTVQELEYDREYQVRIAGGLLSARGAPVRQSPRAEGPGAVFSFLTKEPPPDTEAPRLVASFPVEGQTDYSGEEPIRLDFSERLDSATVGGNSILLLDDEDKAQAVQLVLAEGARRAELQPTQPLKPASKYRVVLTAMLSDREGNALVPDTLSFTTAKAPEPTGPAVLSVRINLPVSARGLVRVVVNGRDTLAVPAARRNLQPDRLHTLEVIGTAPQSAHHLALYEERLRPRPGDMLERNLTVQPFGWVTVVSDRVAEVFIDGQKAGYTPLANYTLPAGKHRLELHPTGQDIGSFGVASAEIGVPEYGGLKVDWVKLSPTR